MRRGKKLDSITKNVKRVGLADILWKAGVACYGTPVTTAGRVHRESTKNVYSLLRKIRLTSYVGLNAGIVYNSDPTSRISNSPLQAVSAVHFHNRGRASKNFPLIELVIVTL